MKRRIQGRLLPDEQVHAVARRIKNQVITDEMETGENTPTMEYGYHEDGTIREKEVEAFIKEFPEREINSNTRS
ncbi:MAG: hypothetical protein Q8936_09260 [Bacillota bacterium]|nr:hypothetical protein [Bacillota bacterium]